METDLKPIISDIHYIILEMERSKNAEKSWNLRLGDLEGGLKDISDRLACIGS